MELEARIRERLDDWVENALDPSNCADALTAVLDELRTAEEFGDEVEPDDIRFVIARVLRVEGIDND